MEWIILNWDTVLLAITSIVTAASIIVKLTPTQKDDAVMAKILKALELISLNKKS